MAAGSADGDDLTPTVCKSLAQRRIAHGRAGETNTGRHRSREDRNDRGSLPFAFRRCVLACAEVGDLEVE